MIERSFSKLELLYLIYALLRVKKAKHVRNLTIPRNFLANMKYGKLDDVFASKIHDDIVLGKISFN